jgi:glycosyltransferase 2 family protein
MPSRLRAAKGSRMARILPRVLTTAAKTAVTVLLLVLLFRKIDYATTLRHLRDITPSTGLIGLLILYAAAALASERWRIVLRSIGCAFTGWNLFRLNLIGQFFNQALPSTIGGDGMRVWLLYRHGCSFAEAFNSILIDRISGFAVLGIMSLYGLPTLVERLFAVPKVETVVGVIVMSTASLVLLYGLARVRTRIARFPVGRFVAQIIADVLFLATRPRDSAKIALLSVGTQLSSFVLIWLILRDLGADVSIFGVLIVAPVVMLLLVLPVSIAGWGLREGLFVAGFGLLHVPQDVALAASIVFGLINLVEGLTGGIFWMLQPARFRQPAASAQQSMETTLARPPTKRA